MAAQPPVGYFPSGLLGVALLVLLVLALAGRV